MVSINQSINQSHFSSLLLGVSKELLDLVSPGIPILGLPEPARSQTSSSQVLPHIVCPARMGLLTKNPGKLTRVEHVSLCKGRGTMETGMYLGGATSTHGPSGGDNEPGTSADPTSQVSSAGVAHQDQGHTPLQGQLSAA